MTGKEVLKKNNWYEYLSLNPKPRAKYQGLEWYKKLWTSTFTCIVAMVVLGTSISDFDVEVRRKCKGIYDLLLKAARPVLQHGMQTEAACQFVLWFWFDLCKLDVKVFMDEVVLGRSTSSSSSSSSSMNLSWISLYLRLMPSGTQPCRYWNLSMSLGDLEVAVREVSNLWIASYHHHHWRFRLQVTTW